MVWIFVAIGIALAATGVLYLWRELGEMERYRKPRD
jgi:hypothetical protein